MCARRINSLEEAKELLSETVAKVDDVSKWMIGVWTVTPEGKIWLNKISFDFPTEEYPKVLFDFAEQLVKERMQIANQQAMNNEPLKRALPFANFPMNFNTPPKVEEELKEEEPKAETEEEGEVD